ncbi:DUF975 domain-containing protein [Microcoleus sp. FACHB-53]|nr:DUF975 domain-containing protein [Microcoleus sp. FACHB-53]
MSKNPSLRQPIGPLSVGNVVSAGLRMYRDHFKSYFGLSIKALLWALIPIYGWAKINQIQAIISRQVYKELVNQPEPISTTRSYIQQRFWSFWAAQILIGFMSFGIYFISSLLLRVLVFVPPILLGNISNLNSVLSPISSFLNLGVWFVALLIYVWLYSHFFISELPLAIEHNMNSTNSIGRSWELTKAFLLRIQIIIIVASLITLPIVLLMLVPVFFIMPLFATSSSPEMVLASVFLIGFLGMILAIVGATLMMPFWQAIKAIIYYDIRTRQEGLGLRIRDLGLH